MFKYLSSTIYIGNGNSVTTDNGVFLLDIQWCIKVKKRTINLHKNFSQMLQCKMSNYSAIYVQKVPSAGLIFSMFFYVKKGNILSSTDNKIEAIEMQLFISELLSNQGLQYCIVSLFIQKFTSYGLFYFELWNNRQPNRHKSQL